MAIIRENDADANADIGTNYTIVLGDVFQGSLDPANDKDWIRVELTTESIYDFTLTGVDAAQLHLYDSEGNLVVTAHHPKIIISPEVSGTYYINIGSNDREYSGNYELSITENTIPVGTYDEIANYLTDGYGEWDGSGRNRFEVETGGVLTVNISTLTEERQTVARWAIEAWSNVDRHSVRIC